MRRPAAITAAGRRSRDCRPRYFFFSILVTVSPDWLAVKLT
jgi:hypothetical protein